MSQGIMDRKNISGKVFSRALLASPVLWAAVIFCTINLVAAAVNPPVVISPGKFPTRTTWEWLRTNSYLTAEKTPDVVLMGSSLMMIPLTLVDADFSGQTLDAVDHPQSVYLEQLLEKQLGRSGISCFNFALPGGMISDDYLIAKSLLTTGQKPKVIVLGLALRDFIDNGVGCAADTPTYQFFRHFLPLDDVQDLAVNTLGARLEYWQNQLIFLWNKRMELQALAAAQLQDTLSSLMPGITSNGRPEFADSATIEAPSQNVNSNQLAAKEVRRGTFLIAANLRVPFQDNSREYKNRYRTSNRQLFDCQKIFLNRLLELTDAAGITTIIVNMPLTQQNMNLMPPGSYSEYKQSLMATASAHRTTVIDLNRSPEFPQEYFNDTAHMNGIGGRKLATEICNAICGDRSLSRNLSAENKTAQSTAKSAAN
jgi:hypothetical protein